jgi:hypothetical protein
MWAVQACQWELLIPIIFLDFSRCSTVVSVKMMFHSSICQNDVPLSTNKILTSLLYVILAALTTVTVEINTFWHVTSCTLSAPYYTTWPYIPEDSNLNFTVCIKMTYMVFRVCMRVFRYLKYVWSNRTQFYICIDWYCLRCLSFDEKM